MIFQVNLDTESTYGNRLAFAPPMGVAKNVCPVVLFILITEAPNWTSGCCSREAGAGRGTWVATLLDAERPPSLIERYADGMFLSMVQSAFSRVRPARFGTGRHLP